jgi:uncharacterized membrane-anchored protein
MLRHWLLLAGACAAPVACAFAQKQQGSSPLDGIQWAAGPAVGRLADIAQVAIPASCRFSDARGAKQFLEATHNPASGDEKGVLLCEDVARDSSIWFVVFTYHESGFVRDDEKASLDQSAILKTLQRGTEAGNEERRSRGWDELEVLGWQRPPYYDAVTNNLTWSTRVRTKGSLSESINHSVRLLGRGGVMNADLVADPEQVATAVVTFDGILKDYSYTAGNRYSEWREGDKVAEYGLTALIAGGAGAAAAKLGLFGKLWKLIVVAFLTFKKLLIVAVLGAAAYVKNLFSKRGAPALAAVPGSAPVVEPTDMSTESRSQNSTGDGSA